MSAGSEAFIDETTGSHVWTSDQFMLLLAWISNPVKMDRSEFMLTGWESRSL